MAEPTIFKRIIDREIPAKIVYEDDFCLAFEDINPQAPVHLMLIPKQEIPSVADIQEDDIQVMGRLMLAARKIGEQLGLENGYRLVANCGEDAGQEVMHLHFHFLAGRPFRWPPG